MAVEASDEAAVIWTKPDDFKYDEKNPIAGLVGLRRGGFNVAMCDGSVRFITESINREMLRRLFLRNDRMIVNFNTEENHDAHDIVETEDRFPAVPPSAPQPLPR